RCDFLSRLPPRAGWPTYAQALPGRGLSGCRRRSAGPPCRDAAWGVDGRYRRRRQRDAGTGLLPRPLCHCAICDVGWARGRTARSWPARHLAGGGAAMTLRLFIPADAGALAVGAEEVAAALRAAAARQKVAVDVVRTGSRGLYWLEPMVELQTSAGRVAYGPVAASDAEGLLRAILADGAHALRQGLAEEIPWLKRQTRLTFARCGVVDPRSLEDYRAHDGCKGLDRTLALGPAAT